MKFNKWTVGLAALAAVSLMSSFEPANAQIQPNLLPPLTISDYSGVVTNADGTLSITVKSQAGISTNTVPSQTTLNVGATAQALLDQVLHNSNLLWEVHGLYAPGLTKKYGGGVGVVYPFTPYVFTSIRVDWVNGGFWMPQGNVGIQAPLTLYTNGTSKIVITPFGYGGVAVPVSGATVGSITIGGASPINNDGKPTAILGAGGALDLYSAWHLKLVGDVEDWSNFPGQQYRVGFTIHI